MTADDFDFVIRERPPGFRPPARPQPGTPEGLAYVEEVAREAIHGIPLGKHAATDPDSLVTFLENGAEMARALGIPVKRSRYVPLGTLYAVSGTRGELEELILGDERTFTDDYAERALRTARLAARLLVRRGLRRFDPKPPRPDAEELERILINPELRP